MPRRKHLPMGEPRPRSYPALRCIGSSSQVAVSCSVSRQVGRAEVSAAPFFAKPLAGRHSSVSLTGASSVTCSTRPSTSRPHETSVSLVPARVCSLPDSMTNVGFAPRKPGLYTETCAGTRARVGLRSNPKRAVAMLRAVRHRQSACGLPAVRHSPSCPARNPLRGFFRLSGVRRRTVCISSAARAAKNMCHGRKSPRLTRATHASLQRHVSIRRQCSCRSRRAAAMWVYKIKDVAKYQEPGEPGSQADPG